MSGFSWARRMAGVVVEGVGDLHGWNAATEQSVGQGDVLSGRIIVCHKSEVNGSRVHALPISTFNLILHLVRLTSSSIHEAFFMSCSSPAHLAVVQCHQAERGQAKACRACCDRRPA